MEYADRYWVELEGKYGAHWKDESPKLPDILDGLQRELSPRYRLDRPLGVGGVGIVLRVKDANLKGYAAVKFPRPRVGKEEFFKAIVKEEISQLLEVSHPNIVSIRRRGNNRATGAPFYIMDYVPNAQDAAEHLLDSEPSEEAVLSVLAQILNALVYLHGLDLVHLDVKLENVLVSSDGRAALSDLGSARKFGKTGKVDVIFTRAWAHPELAELHVISSTPDENRQRVQVDRRALRKAFDLFALGLNIRRILDAHPPGRVFSACVRKYLELMAARLLDGQNPSDFRPLGLADSAFLEIRYKDIREADVDMRKITGAYSIEAEIPELQRYGLRTLQTSSIGPTPLTPRVKSLIEHPALRRLQGVSQLGMVNLVYPTATHTRFEHVVGTFTNAVLIADALYSDPINPFFRQIMSEDDIKALLLAALCHDLGQYPLAHDLEEADRSGTRMSAFSHLELTMEFLGGSATFLQLDSLREAIENDWGVSPQRVVSIISANPRDLSYPFKDRLLHTVIDGPLDADKLDYLVRDSVNIGVPFSAAIDVARLLRTLTVVFRSEEQGLYVALGIHEKGRVAAESVAFARYAMFGAVYWQHTSRAAKAMLHYAVVEGLASRTVTATHLKRALRDLVGGLERGEQLKLMVQSNAPGGQPKHAELEPPSYLLPGDDAMVEWLKERTTEQGRHLLSAIKQRQLYKRVLIISGRKAGSGTLWENLISLAREGWQPRRLVQQGLQKRVVEELEKVQREGRTTTSLAPDRIDNLKALTKTAPLLLVDIPLDRPGSRTPLEYLPEGYRRETKRAWRRPVALEDSVIWRQLHERFLQSVGKVRVFCHPDHYETVLAGIDEARFLGLLESTVEEVLGPGGRPSKRRKQAGRARS